MSMHMTTHLKGVGTKASRKELKFRFCVYLMKKLEFSFIKSYFFLLQSFTVVIGPTAELAIHILISSL